MLRDFAQTISKKVRRPEPRHLWDFIVARLEASNLGLVTEVLKTALERGEAFMLLDGLDEIQSVEHRKFVRDAVLSFSRRYAKSRFLVTCRVLSYQDRTLQLAGFPVFELAPFDKEKIAHFISCWYKDLVGAKVLGQGEAADLSGRLANSVRRSDLRHLAPNPLLLTVMALVNTHKGCLPEARAVLYEDAVDVLLWRWDQLKATGEGGRPRLMELLREAGRTDVDLKRTLWQLAYDAHVTGAPGEEDALSDIKEWRLLEALSGLHPQGSLDWASQMINTIKLRAGLLLEREPGIYTFPHRTFQEYLAGAYLSTLVDFPSRAAGLAEKGDIWREPILLGVGRLVHVFHDVSKPLVLANELCPVKRQSDDKAWRKAWLAGDVLVEMGLNRAGDSQLGKDLIERLRKRLAELIAQGALAPVERAAAGNVLAKLADPRFRADAWFLPDDGMFGFKEIPEGSFTMGTEEKDIPDLMKRFGGEEGWYQRETPQHKTTVRMFYLSLYPVTVAQFKLFVEQSGYEPEDKDCLKGLLNHPVVYVTWRDAIAYCGWLTGELRGREGIPGPIKKSLSQDGWAVRLPTEAEWEKAARGDKEARIFPWGDDPDPDKANYNDTGIGATSAVGCFPKGESPYGMLDMSGNVWEWCATKWEDRYQNYGNNNDLEAGDKLRTVRGGAFSYRRRFARVACRFRFDPDYWDGYLGFRVVVAPRPTSDL